MRCMYGFCKNDSRILKHTENITSFTAYDFQDFFLHYREGHIKKKELMTHCKDFNDCLKFLNWVESCGCSHDYTSSIHFVGESGHTFPQSVITILSK